MTSGLGHIVEHYIRIGFNLGLAYVIYALTNASVPKFDSRSLLSSQAWPANWNALGFTTSPECLII